MYKKNSFDGEKKVSIPLYLDHIRFLVKTTGCVVTKFQRNVYDCEVLKESKRLECLENFYMAFQKFVNVSVVLYSSYDNDSDNEYINCEEVANFCREYYYECESFCDIYDEIYKTKIKFFQKNTH